MEQIIALWLLVLAIMFIPAIHIAKIKYFKISRKKKYKGWIELILPFSFEWWLGAITWGIPIFGNDSDPDREKLRRIANFRTYLLYMIVFTMLMVLGL